MFHDLFQLSHGTGRSSCPPGKQIHVADSKEAGRDSCGDGTGLIDHSIRLPALPKHATARSCVPCPPVEQKNDNEAQNAANMSYKHLQKRPEHKLNAYFQNLWALDLTKALCLPGRRGINPGWKCYKLLKDFKRLAEASPRYRAVSPCDTTKDRARVVSMPKWCMASEAKNSRTEERKTARPSPPGVLKWSCVFRTCWNMWNRITHLTEHLCSYFIQVFILSGKGSY